MQLHPKLASSLAGGTVGGALTIIIVWLLGFWHITVPDDVAQAFTILFGAALGLLAGYNTISTTPAPPAQGT